MAVKPNDFKNLIPGPNSGLCGKFMGVFQLPRKVWEFVSEIWQEDGTFTDEFEAKLCALGCTGNSNNGDVNPSMPSPATITASDGGFSDKIFVEWAAVLLATSYELWRSPAANTDPNAATLLATITAPTVTYDDTTAIQGAHYNYWVRAKDATNTSNFRGPDEGYATAPTEDLPAITDLMVSKGYYATTGGALAVVWTKVPGAETYSVYRNTVNDFATATVVAATVTPTSTGAYNAGDLMYDNDDEIVFYDVPPGGTTLYYYWVVAQKNAPPAVSPESNVDSGWIANGKAPFDMASATYLSVGTGLTTVVPASAVRARIILRGCGGGGAGAGATYGGGGGGGAAIVGGEFAVTPGWTIALVFTPNNDTGNALNQTSGVAGALADVTINAVIALSTSDPAGGVYSAAGAGAGGAGGTGTVAGGAVNPFVIEGRDGKPGAAGAGGKSGNYFGQRRFPGAFYDGAFIGPFWDGDAEADGGSGSGSFSPGGDPTLLPYAKGGNGQRGIAFIAYSLT